MTPDHDSELGRLNEQVVTCLRQGRFAQALPLATRVCEEIRYRAGGRSPELASSLSRLAEAHRELGQLSQAEKPCLRWLSQELKKKRERFWAIVEELLGKSRTSGA